MEQGERRMTKEELEKEAEEYLAEHSEYSEVFEETFVAVDTLTAMVDFAEPREKRIAELIALINAERERQEKCDDVHLRKIAELEKENAELKEKLKPENCLKLLAKEGYIKFTSDQLTKAKEIIRELLSCLYSVEYDCISDLEEAEQFLSEVEK